ncbi:hypothetical protein MNEG_5114 [Monoraphidium neglectum]|uniref:Uncharacterized protein n=1 Tax=Monoraphidium neglectum TaxID=145388 RepID=A0A0D2L7L5_9CHLO|nr:hypothetical protein MNEG_5114 [Monoraphidium neglectum]KIZ02849.1 hypothetical protein MNEG_5114 [Monoraphidium neglectum]|eukprot:XP_013901868.1 hypothetical protein MNEG_5114 [Monoraphidium neglectum]
MCASVGSIAEQRGPADGRAGSGQGVPGGGGSGCEFTHWAHFRLASRAALGALLRHQLHTALLRDALSALTAAADEDGVDSGGGGGRGSGIMQLAFEGRVAKQLESLFRRGDEFGEGCELLLLLRPGGGGAAAQADDFVARLAALAESPGMGALQASGGATVPVDDAGSVAAAVAAAGADISHVLIARFPSIARAHAFLKSPPCAAAELCDARLPLHLHMALAAVVEPGDEASTRVQGV